jgi:hypothetical protein
LVPVTGIALCQSKPFRLIAGLDSLADQFANGHAPMPGYLFQATGHGGFDLDM